MHLADQTRATLANFCLNLDVFSPPALMLILCLNHVALSFRKAWSFIPVQIILVLVNSTRLNGARLESLNSIDSTQLDPTLLWKLLALCGSAGFFMSQRLRLKLIHVSGTGVEQPKNQDPDE